MDSEQKTPGLTWRTRKDGRRVPYWLPTAAARKAGYPVRSANLSVFAAKEQMLSDRCNALQSQMLLWLDGRRERKREYDGTFLALLDLYQTDEMSSYRRLKPSSLHPYKVYLRKLIAHIGELRIDKSDGRDVRRWWKVWAQDGKTVAAAGMSLGILKAAISFGIECRYAGCAEFSMILSQLEFPKRPRRTAAPTADDITRVRQAAHARGGASRALAYALQFETTLRQRDVWGEWVPLSDPRPSTVLYGRRKWLGPTWAMIDANLVLRLTPSKTETTTGVSVDFDLSLCPMVMEELAKVPPEARSGPLIVSTNTGLPYTGMMIRKHWRSDAEAAGVATVVWNRDIRAGGITEGGKAGGSLEDRAKVAGHTGTQTTARVYDRDTLEAHRRLARARAAKRGEE